MKVQNTNDKQTKEKEAAREAVGVPIIPIVPVSLPGSSTLQRSGSLSSVRSSSSLKDDKPGPACSKKGGEKSSRRSSSSSVTSIRSESALAAENARRTSREIALGEKRKIDSPMNKDEEEWSDTDVEVEIVDTEGSHSLNESEEEEGSDVVMEEPSSKNRKRKRNGQNKGSVPTKRGRGRPPTTGQYLKLAEAKRALNVQLKEEIALQKAKAWRELSYGDLLSNLGIDLDNSVDDLKQDPTADISNRTRKLLAEVLIIAKTSDNLKGICQKELKHAAVMATAAVEVLRTCADNPTDDDMPRQLKALKDELEQSKTMAKEAQRKVEKLHKKLEEERARDKRNKVNYVVDSDSASTSPERSTKSRKEKEKEKAEGKGGRRRGILRDSPSPSPPRSSASRKEAPAEKEGGDSGEQKRVDSSLNHAPMEVDPSETTEPTGLGKKEGKKCTLPPPQGGMAPGHTSSSEGKSEDNRGRLPRGTYQGRGRER